jgi:ABC-type transport system involved in multi-copper enzyme maturation permease subunit
MKRILSIAKNTFRETMRDKILLSVVVIVVAIIFFSLFVASISLDQSTRIILNFGITAIYALQIFIAIFIGSMLMYKEIERKTFYLLLPKPVTRTEIILGKCLGLTMTTVSVTILATIALLIVIALYGGKFTFLPIIISLILSTFEALILILISILFSSFTSPIVSAVATLTFFLVGHSGEIFRYMILTSKSLAVQISAMVSYYILPNLEKFNIRNDIVYEKSFDLYSFGMSFVYALAYGLLILCIAQIIFKKKDF